ncbi:hypothetical protein MMC25_001076 [Agyrium rufum]|nr:hypothetical protein [Agyrium rufum]
MMIVPIETVVVTVEAGVNELEVTCAEDEGELIGAIELGEEDDTVEGDGNGVARVVTEADEEEVDIELRVLTLEVVVSIEVLVIVVSGRVDVIDNVKVETVAVTAVLSVEVVEGVVEVEGVEEGAEVEVEVEVVEGVTEIGNAVTMVEIVETVDVIGNVVVIGIGIKVLAGLIPTGLQVGAYAEAKASSAAKAINGCPGKSVYGEGEGTGVGGPRTITHDPSLLTVVEVNEYAVIIL